MKGDAGMASVRRPHVLCVDDEPVTLRLVSRILEDVGMDPESAGDPVAALATFDGGSFDLVLTDIRMPGMNGFQLARELCQLRPDVSIVLMSSFEINKEEFNKVLPSTEVAAFITKPISKNLLLDTVGALFVDGR